MTDLNVKQYLTKRNNGIWYVGLKLNNGKISWRSTGEKDKRKAQAVMFSPENLERISKPSESSIKLSEFLNIIKERIGNTLSTYTLVNYTWVVEKFIEVVGDLQITEIAPLQIEKFKSIMYKGKMGDSSFNSYIRSLKAVFNRAVKWHFITESPLKHVEKIRTPNTVQPYLTPAQFEIIRNCISEPFLKDLVLFCMGTGCRIGEVLNVKWADIDLKNNLIHIRNTEEFQTKANKERTIPIAERVKTLLISKFATKSFEYLFSDSEGNKLNYKIIIAKFKRAVKEARKIDNTISEKIHLHSLRHSFTAMFLESGGSPYDVSQILGHSSTAMVQKIYGHLSNKYKQEKMSKLKF